jgi:uncharacterized protein (TIGR04255 family)
LGTKLKTAPVYYTVAQAVFNPVMSLETYAPRIQELLRKDFPDAQKGILATINLNGNPASSSDPPQLPIAHTTRFTFANMNRTAGFILDPSALSFQTTEYEDFEKFQSDFLKGLDAVNQIVALSYTDRLGLRYLNAVFPNENENVKDYLCSSFLGLRGQVDGTIVHSFSETLVKHDSVNVRSRVIVQNGDVAFPPDLNPVLLNVAERFRALRGHNAIIDTDGWIEARESLSLESIREKLDSIHSAVEKIFQTSVTEHAMKVWA